MAAKGRHHAKRDRNRVHNEEGKSSSMVIMMRVIKKGNYRLWVGAKIQET